MEKDVQTNMGTPAPEGVIQPTTPVVQPSEPVNTPIQPMSTQQPTVAGGINPTTPVAPMAPQAPQGGGLAGLKAKLFSHGVGPVVAAVVVILLLVAGVSYKMITSSPKNVFKGAINSAYKDVDAAFTAFDEFTETYNFEEKAIVVDFDTTLDTNVKEITEIITLSAIKDLYHPYHEMDIRQFVDKMNDFYKKHYLLKYRRQES